MTQTKQKPAYKVKEGRVEAAVWRHEGKRGVNFSVSVSRSYKRDDQWKKANGFFAEDILTLIDALHNCRHWIREQNRLEGRGGNVETPSTGETVA